MELNRHSFLLLFLFISAQAFPTDKQQAESSSASSEESYETFVPTNPQKKSARYNGSSLMTTSSLLFKDTKPILTYLLGQPKKQGSVSSPAALLSPDRYEFFTFDDDGQIVKKLMTVKEIQKIIANTEKAFTGEHGTPIEYYQILTVTPDVESIPSVSRINPNEPLFSIHDVIASVQNVLKSEINIKQSQLKLDNTKSSAFNSATAADSESANVFVKQSEQSGVDFADENERESSSFSSQPALFNRIQSSSTEAAGANVQNPTTRLSDKQANESTDKVEELAETRETTHSEQFGSSKVVSSDALNSAEATQEIETFTKTSKPVPTTSIPLSTFILTREPTSAPLPSDGTTLKEGSVETVVNKEQSALSLSDAHPAIISNDTFLDMEPFTFTQNWRIDESDSEDDQSSVSPNPVESFVKVITDGQQGKLEVKPTSVPETEISTSGDHISITPDLANSVSSVLWQIASENALLEGGTKTTESSLLDTTVSQAPESFETSETKTHGHQNKGSSALVRDSAFVQSTDSEDKLEENPFTVLESILRTQNKPTSVQSVQSSAQSAQEANPNDAELLVEETLSTSTAPKVEDVELVSEKTKEETHTETNNAATEISKAQEEVSNVNNQSEDVQTNESHSSEAATPTPVVFVSPEAVFQSPEQVKPVIDKSSDVVLNNATLNNETASNVEVQVVQEANVGHIPRTTEFPGQVVKEIQRKESQESELISTESTASSESSSSDGFSTQVPTDLESVLSTEQASVKEDVTFESVSDEVTQLSVTTVASEEEEKEVTPSEEVDITFVPMVIKTPSEVKTEGNESALAQEEKEVEVRHEEENTQGNVSSDAPTVDEADDLESKKLPDSESDIESSLPVTTTTTPTSPTTTKTPVTTTTVINQKTKVSGESHSNVEEEIGTLKQNIPIKYTSGKPQSSSFTKPFKGKPQGDFKPSSKPQPSASKPAAREPPKGSETKKPYENHLQSSPSLVELEAAPPENLGLDATVVNLDEDIKRFSELCNELAFSLWSSVTHNGLSFVRSIVVSPFAVTSLLAMVFLGARGPTSGQMNDVLKLDDMVSFNPHLVFRNVTESLVISRNPGVATAAFVRELYSDKSKGKLLDFYKERAQQFYDGHVEEINFKTVGDTLRRQTNHLVKRQTWGKMTDFLRGSNLIPKPPLAAFGANIFQTDCSKASIKDRDGEMYFVILPASRLRRLVPIPAAVWRSDFLAGYEPQLDATAVSIGSPNSAVSTIFVLPGQQGLIAPGDTLARLEHHLLGSPYRKGHWARLMKSLLPRPGLELQIPRLSHKSVINVTSSLQRMGLKDLFSADKADLTGLNGLANDLHLSDMLQVNLFSTCGEEPLGARHHSEVYPATPILRREKSSDGVSSDSLDNLFAISDFEDPAISALPLELRPRQARLPLSKPGAKIPEPPRLRFDRPFLFFVRHNPTGLILHMGRFNPRLTP